MPRRVPPSSPSPSPREVQKRLHRFARREFTEKRVPTVELRLVKSKQVLRRGVLPTLSVREVGLIQYVVLCRWKRRARAYFFDRAGRSLGAKNCAVPGPEVDDLLKGTKRLTRETREKPPVPRARKAARWREKVAALAQSLAQLLGLESIPRLDVVVRPDAVVRARVTAPPDAPGRYPWLGYSGSRRVLVLNERSLDDPAVTLFLVQAILARALPADSLLRCFPDAPSRHEVLELLGAFSAVLYRPPGCGRDLTGWWDHAWAACPRVATFLAESPALDASTPKVREMVQRAREAPLETTRAWLEFFVGLLQFLATKRVGTTLGEMLALLGFLAATIHPGTPPATAFLARGETPPDQHRAGLLAACPVLGRPPVAKTPAARAYWAYTAFLLRLARHPSGKADQDVAPLAPGTPAPGTPAPGTPAPGTPATPTDEWARALAEGRVSEFLASLEQAAGPLRRGVPLADQPLLQEALLAYLGARGLAWEAPAGVTVPAGNSILLDVVVTNQTDVPVYDVDLAVTCQPVSRARVTRVARHGPVDLHATLRFTVHLATTGQATGAVKITLALALGSLVDRRPQQLPLGTIDVHVTP